MSLQLLAKQMEAKGRKGDSMLVHMTAKEVAALQKMAESAGGSLSVNPETGLVEANFLKRMLPTLVGIGVGAATMNPYAGAAAGAAVGGYQAKRNDQDVLLGAAMGGLGGYGGASMGAGLGAAGNAAASQAATAANPAFMGPMPGAAGGFEAAQAGLSGLGTEAGRGAFMSQVGGGAGLAKTASMAATPLTPPGKAPGEAPTDDEMYVYDFDYGRTGADSMPTDSSAERRYFNPTFSNRRKIKAADYFNAAEGGEVNGAADAGGMSGASKAAFDYLMGNAPTSRDPARMEPQMMQGIGPAPASSQAPVVGGDNMYAFDPATGGFLRNPNIAGASTSGSPVGTSFSGSGGNDNAPMSQQTKDFFDRETPPQRDARMAEVQNLFSLGPTGALFSAFGGKESKAPNFGTLFGTGDAYKNLGYDYNQAGGYNPSSGQSYAESVGMGGDYGYSGYSDGGDGGDGPDGWKAGGLTGLATGGQINLQGTFDVGQGGGGQFGQANANGYQAAGGGPLQGFSSSFGQMGGSDPRAGGGLGNSASPLMGGLSGYGAAMRGLSNMGGFDAPAIQADPQGFAQHMAQMQQREMSMPGSTMLGGMHGLTHDANVQRTGPPIMVGMGGGMARPQGGSLQQLAAQMTPEQRAANQRQMESLTGYGPNGFNHSGSSVGGGQMMGDMRYRPERDDARIAANQANSNFASYAAGGMASMAQGGPSHLGDYSDGGLMGLAKGGMKSGGFVVPADVVSMIGEGNTDAGYNRLKSMIPGATAIKGKDGGQADTVKTSIEGKQPARVAHGEMYIPPETVKRMGGAKKLYAMMDRVREQATGSKKQIKPVSLKQAMA